MELPISMSGSFLPADHDFDPIRPTLTRTSVNSSVFRPPQSPSAASSLSRSIRTVPRVVSGGSSGSRKRARVDTNTEALNSHHATSQFDGQSSIFSDAPSPHPFVNINYNIAGGLDTPTAAQSLDFQNGLGEEQDYRPNRFTIRQQQQYQDGYFPKTPLLLSREANGRRRANSTPSRPGWGRTVWAFTGGVAGKVINFCWSTAFSGFRAGGGTGYQMEAPMQQSIWSDVGEKEDVFHANYRARGSTPVPGQFPRETLIEDYMSDPQSYQQHPDVDTPTQTEVVSRRSRLNGGWTMVNESDAQSRETSPVRKRPKSSSNAFEPHRPASRGSTATRPKIAPSRSSTSNASFASPRGGALFRPSASDGPVHGHRRSRSSIASPRRSELQFLEPASPEVKEFEKKIRRKEKVQDESMRKLNRQLKDMIREGKQALGTTVEIHYDVDEVDEGYAEGSDSGKVDKWLD